MKKKWVSSRLTITLLFGLMFGLMAGAGTSVGNFKRLFESEFDFEVRYPDSWTLQAVANLKSEETVDNWLVINSPTVSDPAKQSHIQFAFVKDFPAKNQDELLKEIKTRHPGLEWQAVNNPDFVGFQSTPTAVAQGSLQNMEYYLADIGKVVRIDITRNAEKNGAAESDLILSTIRKPSIPISIDSVSYSQAVYKPGDRACITLHVDALKAAEQPTVTLTLKGELKQWIYRDQKFNAEAGTFEVCQTMTRAMPTTALFIEQAMIENGLSTIVCNRPKDRLVCKTPRAEKVSNPIQEPIFKNDSPDMAGPQVARFTATADQKGFTLDVHDESGVAFAQVDFQDNSFSTQRQMILFEDDLKDPQHVYAVPTRILAPGFNLIRRLTLFDKIGNVTLLYANDATQKNYQSIFNQRKSELSSIPYVSVVKP